jgi:uncharacterized RDD family membrane protein YckC
MRYAGFWRRAAAHVIDFALADAAIPLIVENILFGSMYAVYFVLTRIHHAELKSYDDAFDPVLEQVVSCVVALAVGLPYYIWSTYRYRATLGKKALKIQVVRMADGGPITLTQSWLRCLGYVVSYATLGCGFLMAAFHPQKRCLHDLIAGTVSVIKET